MWGEGLVPMSPPERFDRTIGDGVDLPDQYAGMGRGERVAVAAASSQQQLGKSQQRLSLLRTPGQTSFDPAFLVSIRGGLSLALAQGVSACRVSWRGPRVSSRCGGVF